MQTVLCPILGKSFDLITAVAAVEGKLRTFVTKLIKFNETYKYGHGESPKQSQTRALLFDVSFLMLCSIVNIYGSQVRQMTIHITGVPTYQGRRLEVYCFPGCSFRGGR